MDVREKILHESTRLMAARGAEATSLQTIAEAVGIRKQSVLYYFPSKDELRRAVFEQLLARWNEVLPRLLLATSRAGVARFDAVMTELLAFFATDPDRARLLVRELLDRPAEMEAYILEYVRPWLSVVAETLRRAQGGGTIREEVDPEAYCLQVAISLLCSLATASRFAVALGDDVTVAERRCVEEAVRQARSSLFAPRRPKPEEQHG